MDLARMKCKPCEGGAKPFDRETSEEYLAHVDGWKLAEDGKRISKRYTFRNFKQALDFVNRVGALAEDEGHHPDINFTWGRVDIALSTHAISGLSENDFILAYKIDYLPRGNA